MFVRVKLKKDGTTLLKGGSLYEICDAFNVEPTIYYKEAIEKSMALRHMSCVCDTINSEQWNLEIRKISDANQKTVLL